MISPKSTLIYLVANALKTSHAKSTTADKARAPARVCTQASRPKACAFALSPKKKSRCPKCSAAAGLAQGCAPQGMACNPPPTAAEAYRQGQPGEAGGCSSPALGTQYTKAWIPSEAGYRLKPGRQGLPLRGFVPRGNLRERSAGRGPRASCGCHAKGTALAVPLCAQACQAGSGSPLSLRASRDPGHARNQRVRSAYSRLLIRAWARLAAPRRACSAQAGWARDLGVRRAGACRALPCRRRGSQAIGDLTRHAWVVYCKQSCACGCRAKCLHAVLCQSLARPALRVAGPGLPKGCDQRPASPG